MVKKNLFGKTFLVCLLAGSLALAGCSGDDGRDGVDGQPGAPGQPGQDVQLGEAGEPAGLFNCSTCHGTGGAAQAWLTSAHANQGSHVASCAVACHDPLGDAREMRAAFGMSRSYVVGCESCHGGGDGHRGIGPIPYPAPKTAQCAQCHSTLPESHIVHHPFADAIADRFATSRHANQSARAAACSACHSHEGGVELLAMGRMTSDADLKAAYDENTAAAYMLPVGSDTIVGVTKKTCATCHDPHSSALRGDGDVLASAATVTGFPVAAGTAVDGEIRVAYSAEFNLCTACHMVDLAATWDATEGYNDRGMITYELSSAYSAANLIDAGTGTFVDPLYSKTPFYHDGASGNGRTLVDTHFGGTILSHLVNFDGVATDITIPGYNINPGNANACTICHDPHTGGKMLSIDSSSTIDYADQLDNKVVSYAQGLGDFHTGYTKDAFSRNQTGCNPCHTGNDFVKVTLGGTSAAQRWNVVGCRSCHDLAVPNAAPGANNAAAFAAVREFPADYEFKFNNTNAAVVTAAELGANQVCFECHKGRTAGVLPATDPAVGTTNYAISYLHYAPAMAILFGDDSKMVLTYPDKSYSGRFKHYDGAEFGCVDCHDVHNTNGNHAVTNKMTNPEYTCNGCHKAGALTSADVLQARTEAFSVRLLDTIYDAMIVAANGGVPATTLNAALQAKLVEIYNAATEAEGKQLLISHIEARQAYFPSRAIAHAAASWKIFTYEDGAVHGHDGVHGHGGSWAHNSAFARQVMFDAIQSLGGSTAGLVRPAAN